MDTAQAMVSTGLAKAGYQYINSDDCWMLATRDANGNQVPNPEKFPDGFAAVTKYIHSLGLSSGLYTAKGPNTCAGFAASCDHEFQDAAQWASWGIDYVKDDSCSDCAGRTDNEDYGTMWQAIQASGRPMVLTVEGSPDDALITKGGYGNAKRVGHDISPNWMSMVSLVDIGSGLWMYAHNSTNATYGGWWNDLDMIEVGNSPDFACAQDPSALGRCIAHFTMWCVMKAPLILGSNLPAIDPPTLAVLTNAEAIAVNQDSWGVQAKRVAVLTPKNTTLGGPFDNIAVVRQCDPSVPTQTWFWNNKTTPAKNLLYMVPCDSSDPYQQWSFPGAAGKTSLQNKGSGQCVDTSGQADPAMLKACNGGGSQQFTLESSGHIQSGGSCLDIFNFQGPDVEIYPCKQPGQSDGNQVFYYDAATGVITSEDNQLPKNYCLAAAGGPGGGTLSTKDAAGNEWCIGQGTVWGGFPCESNSMTFSPNRQGPIVNGFANYTVDLSYSNGQGESGPWPHSRYVAAGGNTFTINLAAAQTPSGSTIEAADHTGIINDNLVGNVTLGGDFCLDLVTGGMLEVWAAPLSGNRWSIAVFNRSPGADVATVTWDMFGVSTSTTFAVRDVWAAADKGSFTGSYTTAVGDHTAVLLVLTPSG